MGDIFVDGAKGGESSARTPYIAPDSAQSVTRIKQVIGLSEGEIEGFSQDDIKLDGTAVSNLAATVKFDYRFGSNNQDYIEGLDEVANEIGVGVELKGDVDWVKSITNLDLDSVGIRLRWGPLQTNSTNGDVTGVYIKYTILIAPVGGSYSEVLVSELSDKTSDSYERYHEFRLPVSTQGWLIKVRRDTPSSNSSLVSDRMFVQAYSEIVKTKFNYPYTSLLALEYDARTFQNIAKVSVNAKGLIIKVPANYDPVARTYTGIWNGTFKRAYTNNPAWIYYDLVTNPRYGLGDKIKAEMVDKWSLYKLAQYCDQMVPDGYNGLEPRFTCNVYIQGKERAYDILNRLTGLFRAINFWSGSQIVVDADIPQDTSYLYTNANVIDGLFEYAGSPATERYSCAKVAWDNPLNGYNTEYEAFSREDLIKELGFKVLELDAWGCTSRGQALRAGRWALLAETDTVTFKVGMDGFLALPGKIIEIQDEFHAGKSMGGRIISINANRTQVTVDRDITFTAGDKLSINSGDNSGAKVYTITGVNGRIFTLSSAIHSSIEPHNIWAINSTTLVTQKYRVMTVKYDSIGEFTISATAYNAQKFAEIDSNIIFDDIPTTVIAPTTQNSVQNVVIEQFNAIYQGLSVTNLTIKWERALDAVEYIVEIKKDDGSWLKLPATGNNAITLENVYSGVYIAKITAVSAFEIRSLPAFSVKTTITGKATMPSAPINPVATSIPFGVEFSWGFPPGSGDTAYSRIQVSGYDPTGILNIEDVYEYDRVYPENSITITGLRLYAPIWLRVKLVDKLGFESPYTAWIKGESNEDPDAILELLQNSITSSQLHQDLQTEIAKIGENSIAISQEVIARAAAITSEAQSRATAISTEKTERESADNNLSQRIDIVSASAANNAAAIQTEQTARANADSSLSSQITTVAATANAKNKTYSQSTAPTTGMTAGDLWFNTANSNKPYRYSGTAWVATEDTRIAANASAITTEQTARADADTALGSRIDTVVATANSKNKTFLQTTAPTTGMVVGDLWFDTDDSNKPYRYSGSAWTAITDPRIASNTAAITSEATARADADTALGSRIDAVVATASSNTAAIQTEQTARVNADSALSSSITTVQTTVNGHTTSIQTQATSINGLSAQYTVKIDSGGRIAGYGLASTTVNGATVSDFIVRADRFAIAPPASSGQTTANYAFVYQASATTINGVAVPAGLYLDSAYIKYGSITTAHIGNAQIDTAKIGDLAVTTGKIADLSIDTLKIKDNAVTVPVGVLRTTPIEQSSTRQPGSYSGGNSTLLDTSNYFGDVVSLVVNRSGGKCQINGFVYVQNVRAVAYSPGGSLLYGTARQNYCGLILYRNGSPIFYARVASSSVVTNEVTAFYGAVSLPTFIDEPANGNVTYTLRIGFSTPISNGGIQLTPWESGNAAVMSASLSVVELKK